MRPLYLGSRIAMSPLTPTIGEGINQNGLLESLLDRLGRSRTSRISLMDCASGSCAFTRVTCQPQHVPPRRRTSTRHAYACSGERNTTSRLRLEGFVNADGLCVESTPEKDRSDRRQTSSWHPMFMTLEPLNTTRLQNGCKGAATCSKLPRIFYLGAFQQHTPRMGVLLRPCLINKKRLLSVKRDANATSRLSSCIHQWAEP